MDHNWCTSRNYDWATTKVISNYTSSPEVKVSQNVSGELLFHSNRPRSAALYCLQTYVESYRSREWFTKDWRARPLGQYILCCKTTIMANSIKLQVRVKMQENIHWKLERICVPVSQVASTTLLTITHRKPCIRRETHTFEVHLILYRHRSAYGTVENATPVYSFNSSCRLVADCFLPTQPECMTYMYEPNSSNIEAICVNCERDCGISCFTK